MTGVPEKSYIFQLVKVYNKYLSSHCNLPAQIEQVQDKRSCPDMMIYLIVFKCNCHIFTLFVNKKLCIFQDIGLQLRGLLASVDEFLQHTSQSGFEEVIFCNMYLIKPIIILVIIYQGYQNLCWTNQTLLENLYFTFTFYFM